jgi:hypothetical protein
MFHTDKYKCTTDDQLKVNSNMLHNDGRDREVISVKQMTKVYGKGQDDFVHYHVKKMWPDEKKEKPMICTKYKYYDEFKEMINKKKGIIGGKRKSRKSRKSRKLRKLRKSRKSRKSKKSRK